MPLFLPTHFPRAHCLSIWKWPRVFLKGSFNYEAWASVTLPLDCGGWEWTGHTDPQIVGTQSLCMRTWLQWENRCLSFHVSVRLPGEGELQDAPFRRPLWCQACTDGNPSWPGLARNSPCLSSHQQNAENLDNAGWDIGARQQKSKPYQGKDESQTVGSHKALTLGYPQWT